MASGLINVAKSEKYLVHCIILRKAYQAVNTNFDEGNLNDESGAKHISAKKAIGIVLLVLSVFIMITVNVATQTLPEGFRPYLWLSWPLLLILVVISIFLLCK
jgi:hypothetical protein